MAHIFRPIARLDGGSIESEDCSADGAWMRALEMYRDLDSLFRINLIFFSAFLPLIGAATVRPAPSSLRIVGLVGVALCFHAFAYVLNDVVDLPFDREHPWRTHDPMVRGALRRSYGLAIAMAAAGLSIPLALVLDGGVLSIVALIGAYACMTVYDLYSKRAVAPPVTDAVQGVAWGLLVVFGAVVTSGGMTGMTTIAFAHTVLLVVAMNGVHGGLRDLDHDLALGAKTTAIVFGARPTKGARINVPRSLEAFAAATTLTLVTVVTVPLALGLFGYSESVGLAMLAIVSMIDLGIVALLAAVLRPNRERWHMSARLHIILMFALMPIALAPRLSPAILSAMAAIVILSILALIASDTWFRISPNAPRRRLS